MDKEKEMSGIHSMLEVLELGKYGACVGFNVPAVVAEVLNCEKDMCWYVPLCLGACEHIKGLLK